MENPTSIMSSRRVNFDFGFNNADFSDRVLYIEITYSKSEYERRRSNDSDSYTLYKVKIIRICSLLLAGNSPFFRKLFKDGVSESKQKESTLKIRASEEAGVMEVLNFMYTNTLKATTTPDVLVVLAVADKFEVRDCVRYCCELLQKMPMSLEYALLYHRLPQNFSMNEEVQPLMDAANRCILAHHEHILFKMSEEERVTTVPLSAFGVLIGSDDEY